MTAPDAIARPDPYARLKWLILALAALTIAGSYYSYDAIAPVAGALRRQRYFSQLQIGTLNAVFSLPNIPLSILGGVVVDRLGAARVSFIAAGLSFAGCVLTALGDPYPLMVVGRLIFGIGTETLYIALLVGLAQWFARGYAALAVGLFFSMARVGSYAADTSTSWAAGLYASGWQAPLWLAAGLTLIGWIAAGLYGWVDRAFGMDNGARGAREAWRWPDMRGFGRSFYDILSLNVLFACVFFPFRSTFSIQYYQDAKGLSLAEAGLANSWVFFAAILATPLFGLIADRIGRRATLLAGAGVLLPLPFLILGATHAGLWVSTALMGLSFSVIPAVIWPATAMLVAKHRLGTAYGLINLLQSLGLALTNTAAGWLNDRFHAGPANPAGYNAMLGFFGVLGLIAAIMAVRLWWREQGPQAHGLELPDRARPQTPSFAS